MSTCRLLFKRDRNRDPLRDEMHAEELPAIHRKHDSAEFVLVVFDVIADILAQRGTELPEPGSDPQNAESGHSASAPR